MPPDKTAFMFPGQGSQRAGMGRLLREADASLASRWGIGPIGTGHSVVSSQEDVVCFDGFLSDHLNAVGVFPDVVCGHSLGELVALYAGGVIDQERLLRIVGWRRVLMSDVPGRMLAIRADAEQVSGWLTAFGESGVWLANMNSRFQSVVGGYPAAVERFGAFLTEREVTSTLLSIDGQSHTPALRDVSVRFQKVLETLPYDEAQRPIYGNNGLPMSDGWASAIADRLVSPVLWVREVERLWDDGVRLFVEVGSGATLSRLVSSVLSDKPSTSFQVVACCPSAGQDREVDGLEQVFQAFARR